VRAFLREMGWRGVSPGSVVCFTRRWKETAPVRRSWRMRIIVMGQALFGARVVEALLERGEEIIAVYAPPERPGSRPDPVKEPALLKNIPVFQPTRYKDDQVFAQYRDLAPDLTILAFVTSLIPWRFLESPARGSICYHPSVLPRHRGASAINWAIIMGDTRTGLTIFWPDRGIDTGPILLQREVDIAPDDTTGSLYFNHLFPMGVEAILESVDLIRVGRAPRIPQGEDGATYEPPCDDRVAGVDWRRTGPEVYNLVRGCDPQPGAYAYWRGEQVRFYSAAFSREAVPERPGTVVAVDSRGLHFAVSGGTLVVGKVRAAKGGKVEAAVFAGEQGLKAGVRFDGENGGDSKAK
jgi:methionyl-tRNA formyltransferase